MENILEKYLDLPNELNIGWLQALMISSLCKEEKNGFPLK
jgi:hypothetical protein